MSGGPYYPGGPASAWERYLANEHAARDKYLLAVQRAHVEYLAGPFPDRDAYATVERDAWLTYYQAGRAAWRSYRVEMDNPPPAMPPARPTFSAAPYVPPPEQFEQRQETYLAADPNRRDNS